MTNKKSRSLQRVDVNRYKKWLSIIPIVAGMMKLIILLRIPPIAWPTIDSGLYRLDKFWLGADGENYVVGLTGLFADGIFSQVERLTYFPAGYPLLMYFMTFWSQVWSLPFVALSQTVFYCLASIYFVNKIVETRISRFAPAIALILAFNPTLALSSYAIGYESPVASLLLISIGLLIGDYKKKNDKFYSREVIVAASIMSLISFLQPRMVVTAALLFMMWALATRSIRQASAMIVVSLVITLLLPATLYARNVIARDVPAVSTNLGTTIFIGVGPEATGGYNGKYNGVPCPEAVGSEVEIDSAKVRCALEWYLENPAKTLELSVRKAIYFWSPWFGPLANGTMARNPWNQNHPLRSTVQTQEGVDLVYGGVGKVISWAWILGTIFLMGLGFWVLWRINGVERLLGTVSVGIIFVNMLVSMATIGDHRFRLPTAGLSLFLQAVGFLWAFSRGKGRLVGPEEKLLWKSFSRTTNLTT
jgi:hypothetical protein